MMAEDSVALLDALDVDTCHLSGLSLGAAIAAQMAIAFPERVQTLQLHGGWAKTHGYAKMYLGMLGRWLDEGGLDLYYEAALLYLFPPDFITDNYDQVMTVLDNMKKNSSPIEGMRGQLDANMSHDISDHLGKISTPTLVTVGEIDMCLPPSFSRELADGIPNSELIIFPGGSHLFGVQDPATFNRITLDWLERVNPISG
ncbi:MAG: alpha/beta hydrolase, partial [Pseudomonadales bacterium]|nr:alpha/beta hydrolase [Pseudomonadales bacterium]